MGLGLCEWPCSGGTNGGFQVRPARPAQSHTLPEKGWGKKEIRQRTWEHVGDGSRMATRPTNPFFVVLAIQLCGAKKASRLAEAGYSYYTCVGSALGNPP